MDHGSSNSRNEVGIDFELKSKSVLQSQEIQNSEYHNKRNNFEYKSVMNYKSKESNDSDHNNDDDAYDDYNNNNNNGNNNNNDNDNNNNSNNNNNNDNGNYDDDEDYVENKIRKYDEDDTNNFLNYDIYERKRPSHIYIYENESLNPPNYSSLPPSPPSSQSSSSSSTTSFSTSYSGSLSSSPSSSIISSTTNSPKSLYREVTNEEKEEEKKEEKGKGKEENFLSKQSLNHGKRNKISIQGLSFLPSDKVGFYNLAKNDEKGEGISPESERYQKNVYPNYIDFQVVLSEADFTILEQRKVNQNRVLQYNNMN